MESAAGGRRGQAGLVAGLLAVVVLGLLFGYGLSRARTVAPAHAGDTAGDPADAPSAKSGKPTKSSKPTKAGRSSNIPVPRTGPGRFVTASGSDPRIGTAGKLVRFRVVVEVGIAVPPADFAAAVSAVLADRRGWTAGRLWSFERVETGRADVTVHLATPGTVDKICARYGLETHGEVSCRGGDNVMINLDRWVHGVPHYAGALDAYRTMLVNHEMGHFLGHGHSTCPGPGRPAPVMQTQTTSLRGCARNPWPYPDGRTYLD